MDHTLADLAAVVAREGGEGLTPTAMPNVRLYKVGRCIELLPETHRPIVSLILQGEKQLLIGDEVVTYRAGHTFTSAFDLPVLGRITIASPNRPYLAVSLAIDSEIVSDTVSTMPDHAGTTDRRAFGVDAASRDLIDAWTRMLQLIDRPEEVRIMAPLLEREIVYRLMQGPQGTVLRQIAAGDPRIVQIREALTMIARNFAIPLKVEDVAQSVGMSRSAFHRQFKAATGMAPLQYQKTLRLHEARRLLLSEPTNASSAAFSVGYQSVSQFSREYGRMFGTAPMREIRSRRLDPAGHGR
jgi:AraC-like DNA-binding protein